MARSSNRFVKGQSTYKCRCCGRLTRQTGQGDNDGVELCVECYSLAGEENHLSDNGGVFYGSPEEVLHLIVAVASKGGDASCWDALKTEAQRQLNKA